MKKALTAILVLIAVLMVGVLVAEHKIDTRDYLRIHIRANSNSEIDQNIKYAIKGEVVKLLTPALSKVSTRDEAKSIVISNLSNIDNVANTMLEREQLPYRAHAVMRREHFPVRHYGNVTLEEGDYDALVVELGRAEGDNWWCVVFPPLCFVTGEESPTHEFRYVSRIAELIKGVR